MKQIDQSYDVVVVGGGISGVCAAIAAARGGVKTALLQNRSVLGGNASAEIRVPICGATRNGHKKDVAETGIMMELFLANKAVNPQNSFDVFSLVLWEKVCGEPNLDLYLNTQFLEATVEEQTITQIRAVQYTSESMFVFAAKQYVDTTGDAILAFESGADWTIGHESRQTYGEAHAPAVASQATMGSTIMFSTKDVGRAVPFHRPAWAYPFQKEQLGGRKIQDADCGFWWIELGGDVLRTIEDSESIRDELYKWVFGIFDYIKNCGEYDADHLMLDWICSVPGRRESRRILGDYVLNENDVYDTRVFEDAVAYGGWTMDDHTVGGLVAKGNAEEGTVWLDVPDVYTIPYRSLYSRNINNLFVGGRAISASHMAMSSTRVMATCGVIGQAIGSAAAMAVKQGVSPRVLGQTQIKVLQRQLIADDCYLPSTVLHAENDACQSPDCSITASGFVPGGAPEQVRNGIARRIKGVENAWIAPMEADGAWLALSFAQVKCIRRIDIKFDPNLSKLIMPTWVKWRIAQQPDELPLELVRDFTLQCYAEGKCVFEKTVVENQARLNQIVLPEVVQCDCVKLLVTKTYGDPYARVFEMELLTQS